MPAPLPAGPAGATAAPKPRLRGWIHLAAVPVAVLGAIVLVADADRSVPSRLSALVFGASLVGLYATSSLYHVPPWGVRVRRILSRCDGAMIQLTIAGTFTPIAFHALEGGWRSWSLTVAWVVAVVGATIAASPLEAPRWVGTTGYIAVGWLTVVPFTKIITALPWEGSGLILLGGVLYTIGALVYAKRWPDPFPHWFGFHEIFHLFVVAASVAHYLAVWRYVLPG